jgi:hypothetical protein
MFRVYRLQRPVSELVVVADSFQTKPLLRILQSADRYHVLGLSRGEIKLFEGNRDALDQIELAPGVPRTITEALGEELTEPHSTVASYGMGAGGPAMHHGHGGRKDEIDSDALLPCGRPGNPRAPLAAVGSTLAVGSAAGTSHPLPTGQP